MVAGTSFAVPRLILSPPKPRMVAQTYLRFQGRIESSKGKSTYKELKNIDGDLRSAYHNDALTGDEFIYLLRNLWA